MRMDLGNALGLLGVAFCIASFIMPRMVPLRVLALAGNVCFIGYGYLESLVPSLALNGILLPVNAVRLWEITRLTREMRRAGQDSPVSQWLLPHMNRRAFKTGEVLFRKDDPADKIIYVASGELAIAGTSERIAPGALVGEIGLFSPYRKRTQTISCETDGELYEMTDEMMFQLYYQHPKLGFYLMRLVAERLLNDLRREKANGRALARSELPPPERSAWLLSRRPSEFSLPPSWPSPPEQGRGSCIHAGRVIAASSASSIMPATLKPVCCMISWKHVGLVTFTSVR